mmetsp:Transcript_80446/g.162941  ORF Transcript_80446/g.162941 Transcript_80446/m.162941 type:complete len:218 (+) Transcript_80446:848-1501(+)
MRLRRSWTHRRRCHSGSGLRATSRFPALSHSREGLGGREELPEHGCCQRDRRPNDQDRGCCRARVVVGIKHQCLWQRWLFGSREFGGSIVVAYGSYNRRQYLLSSPQRRERSSHRIAKGLCWGIGSIRERRAFVLTLFSVRNPSKSSASVPSQLSHQPGLRIFDLSRPQDLPPCHPDHGRENLGWSAPQNGMGEPERAIAFEHRLGIHNRDLGPLSG